MTLPAGVVKYDAKTSYKHAARHLMLTVHGASKTGKTYLLLRCQRPLYLVYLDPNPNLDAHLRMAEEDGWGSDVEYLWLPPIAYRNLTQEKAEERIAQIEAFADYAMKQGKGTFGIDGGMMLRGYYEKALVGESPILGYRPRAGERGAPRTVEYGAASQAVRDLIQPFSDPAIDLDVVVTWEGRDAGSVKTDAESGKKMWLYDGTVKSTMPRQVPFAFTAAVETKKAVERDERGNITSVKHKLLLGWNGYDSSLEGKTMPAKSLIALKKLFLAGLPDTPNDEKAAIQATTLDKEPPKEWLAVEAGEA